MNTGSMIMLNHYQEKVPSIKKRETLKHGNETWFGVHIMNFYLETGGAQELNFFYPNSILL